jgi:phospholipase C
MRFRTAASYLFIAVQVAACGGDPTSTEAGNGVSPRSQSGTDAGFIDVDPPFGDGGRPHHDGGLNEAATKIEHLVVIVQENHTFDDHFGAYCTAVPGSNPTCNDGPSCCEAMPSKDPSGTAPTVLTDVETAAFDPIHAQACELAEIDHGKMDMYVNAPGGCGSPRNVAVSDPTTIKPYWDLAASGALADRYFQSVAGASYANDIYLARGGYEFTDNTEFPAQSVGILCEGRTGGASFTTSTIGDLLNAAAVPWSFFADGYQAMVDAKGACPTRPSDCPYPFPTYPCVFDPSDVPFEYFPSTRDDTRTMKDLAMLDASLKSGHGLPAVSFVKAIGYKTEHPGAGQAMSTGVGWASALIDQIESSPYGASTLVILTYDEGGGYFDHVSPPAANAVDAQPYGTRLPFVAVGPFAKKSFISHVQMEHASIVKFIEWNWLGKKTGQLGTRDTVVNNLGSILDPRATGVAVPEN